MSVPFKAGFPFNAVYEHGVLKAANIVSLCRAVLIGPIVILLLLDQPSWALALYIAAAATDAVDGWLARRQQQGSAYGAALDAAVDNVFSLAIALFLVLAYPDVVMRHRLSMLLLFGLPLAYLAFSQAYCGRLMMFHFRSAKLGALLLFALWPLLAVTGVELAIPTAAAVIAFSRLEQVVYLLRGGTDLNAAHGWVAIPATVSGRAP